MGVKCGWKRRRRADPAGPAAAAGPVGRPARVAPCAPRLCNTRPWDCASPPARRPRDPGAPATAGPAATPRAGKRSSPDGKCGALPGLLPFYTEHRASVKCVRSLGMAVRGAGRIRTPRRGLAKPSPGPILCPLARTGNANCPPVRPMAGAAAIAHNPATGNSSEFTSPVPRFQRIESPWMEWWPRRRVHARDLGDIR